MRSSWMSMVERLLLLGSENAIADDLWRADRYRKDPGYVYSPEERRAYEDFVAANPGETMPAIKPWSFPAFTGAASKPRRLGG